MKLARFALDILLVAFGLIALLGTMAELERRDEAALRAMEKQRQIEANAAKWRDLDAAGRYMTSYNRIKK